MARVRVPIHGAMGKTVTVDTAATEGAELGVNVYWQGRLLDPREVLNAYAPTRTEIIRGGGGGGAAPGGDLTTDAVIEGSRKYFTAPRAVAAVGAALEDSANVALRLDGSEIKADLTETGVTPGTYGDAAHVARLGVDEFGRIVFAQAVEIPPAEWGGVGGELADQLDLQAALDAKADVGRVAINSQAGAYALSATDAGALVLVSSATAVDVTVPAGVLPVGVELRVAQAGAGPVTVAAAAGVTLSGAAGLQTRAQHSVLTLVQTAADAWLVYGDAA